jgi:hypothetical protein
MKDKEKEENTNRKNHSSRESPGWCHASCMKAQTINRGAPIVLFTALLRQIAPKSLYSWNTFCLVHYVGFFTLYHYYFYLL